MLRAARDSVPFVSGVPNNFSTYARPEAEDGWYLLGRDTDRHKLFYSLVYYNEARGLLRTFLFNLELPTNVTGSTLTISLVALLPGQGSPGGGKYLTGQPLEGAFFPLHPNPGKWSSVTVPLPEWNYRQWVCVETPIAYPMASNLPVDLALAASAVATPGSPEPYRSLSEDPLLKGQRCVALAFQLDSYDLGSVEGTWHGDAVGSAVQELGSVRRTTRSSARAS